MTHTFDPRPLQPPPDLGLEEAAHALGVEPTTVLAWLSAFSWERSYDGAGALRLREADLEFLRVVKSLRDVDRSCDSIVRLLADDGEPHGAADDPAAELAEAGMVQVETLKAELRALHARPRRAGRSWRFWRWG
ncbi:MAG: MerR family transcriptional regulator [Candidatus Sericytochromatia bacterium]|nr:MerR family transcriptional regulator [Candidatus Sericytochromatia bacterium]